MDPEEYFATINQDAVSPSVGGGGIESGYGFGNQTDVGSAGYTGGAYGAIINPWSQAQTDAYNSRVVDNLGYYNNLNRSYSSGSGLGTRSSGYSGYSSAIPNSSMWSYLTSFDPRKTPDYESYPSFSAPTYDEKRARQLGYSQAVPYINEIRNAANRGVARLFGRDATPGDTLRARSLMGDVGTQISKAQATGAAYGRQVYGDIYNKEYDASKASYLAKINEINQRNAYLNQMTTLAAQAVISRISNPYSA